MNTVKEAVQEILDRLPDSATLEEIIYELRVRQKVERGLQDVAAGRTMTTDELKRRLGLV